MPHENAANGSPGRTASSARNTLVGLDALQQAALQLADIRRGTSRFKTKDLVNLLLCHAARSRRVSQTRTTIRVRACAPEGHQVLTLVV
jgi:hypothetical protein